MANVFPTLAYGQVCLYPITRTREQKTVVLKFLNFQELRWQDRIYLASFRLVYSHLSRTDLNTLKAFFLSTLGAFDSSAVLTIDGITYGNVGLVSDQFDVTEDWPNLFNVTMEVQQYL